MQKHHPAAAVPAQKDAAIGKLDCSLRLQPRPLDCHIQLYESLKTCVSVDALYKELRDTLLILPLQMKKPAHLIT
jgi:hypothetical protein